MLSPFGGYNPHRCWVTLPESGRNNWIPICSNAVPPVAPRHAICLVTSGFLHLLDTSRQRMDGLTQKRCGVFLIDTATRGSPFKAKLDKDPFVQFSDCGSKIPPKKWCRKRNSSIAWPCSSWILQTSGFEHVARTHTHTL